MYSPVSMTSPEAAARAVVAAAHGSAKPVLAAWLGDISPGKTRSFLEEQGLPNFYTPENAVEAFSFLCAFRRNQAQLLEAPGALSGRARPQRPDIAAVDAIRDGALAGKRTILTEHETKAMLAMFGLPVPRTIVAADRAAAVAAADALGYPVVLKIHSPDITHKSDVGGVRLNLQNAEMVASSFDDMIRHVRALQPAARIEGAAVQPMLRFADAREVLVGVATDPVFGPVISFGAGGIAVEAIGDAAMALPPLNASLARELIDRTRISRLLAQHRDVRPADVGAIAAVLEGVSQMVCALPWLKEMDLNPVIAHPAGAVIADARIVIDPSRLQAPRYGHMAIHPYPSELEHELKLRDGSRVPVRPIRPEDAALEIRFFEGLSENSRYQRFLNQMAQLPPQLLARFTQIDYDREMALVAVAPGTGEFIGVGRYAPNADGQSAEFALTVADAWQGRGLGKALLEQLCSRAREAGYVALDGHILNANNDMLGLAEHLGFVRAGHDGDTVTVVRRL
jgi:acetyltransferase